MHPLGLTKQRQLNQTEEIKRSFKATTDLAKGLTKQRITVQHEMHKVDTGKSQLEEFLKSKKKGTLQPWLFCFITFQSWLSYFLGHLMPARDRIS